MFKELVRTKTPITAIGGYTLHPGKHNLSFGRWAIPVMAKKMQDPDPMEKRRAINALCDFVFDSRRVASKEFRSVIPHLKNACEDENAAVREATARCFGTVAATAAGRRTFGQHDFYQEVQKLITDDEKSIRHAANIALERLTLSPMASEELVASGAIPILVSQIPKEEDATLEILLTTLHACYRFDRNEALLSDGLENTIPLLKSSNSRVREKAANVIKELTVDAEGRIIALSLDALPILLDLLNDEDEQVQAKSLSALMMIVNSTPAKLLSLENNAIEALLPFLKNENSEIRLNSIKVLTALGEAPTGRSILLDNIHKIKGLLNDKIIEIQIATKKMISVATFQP